MDPWREVGICEIYDTSGWRQDSDRRERIRRAPLAWSVMHCRDEASPVSTGRSCGYDQRQGVVHHRHASRQAA